MKTLISFLIKHHFFIFFLFLEIICFMLIYSSSNYQRYTMINGTNAVTGGMNDFYSGLTDYFRLKQENERLAEENALLKSIYRPDSLLADEPFHPLTDTAFRYISARVISNSINKRSNYFMIDKGELHGIRTDMGVVSADGVAGIIVATSEHFATAMSLLHMDARISGKVLKNGQMASISWPGKHYRNALASDIPDHIRLSKGDTLVTSGHSLMFPEGLIIGFVDEYRVRRDQLFNEATIGLGTDFNRLYYVYVIENMNSQEVKTLDSSIENE